MITVKFFAQLRERLARDEVKIDVPDNATVGGIIDALIAQDEGFTILNDAHLLHAVNHAMVPRDTAVKSGDEVALFPPVTGG